MVCPRSGGAGKNKNDLQVPSDIKILGLITAQVLAERAPSRLKFSLLN